MEFQRDLYNKLLYWKALKHRKPPLLRGARQVGKTTLVSQFAKEFSNYIELTLEKKADRDLFERTDEISKLVSSIYFLKQSKPGKGSTLIFIDEIQESPKAIQLLRYLHEEKPDLFVIAAGSLLEFALKQVPSFPVGRIEYLTLHPVNFPEFLGVRNPGARKTLSQIPVPEYASLKNKIFQFKENSSTNKNIFLTMLTTFGVIENAYSLELVTNSLLMDCLFEENR